MQKSFSAAFFSLQMTSLFFLKGKMPSAVVVQREMNDKLIIITWITNISCWVATHTCSLKDGRKKKQKKMDRRVDDFFFLSEKKSAQPIKAGRQTHEKIPLWTTRVHTKKNVDLVLTRWTLTVILKAIKKFFFWFAFDFFFHLYSEEEKQSSLVIFLARRGFDVLFSRWGIKKK
jgi:hypothetical protein